MFVTADLKPTTCAADAVAMLRVWRAAALVHRWEVWSVGVAVWQVRRRDSPPQVVLRPLRLVASGVAPLRIQAAQAARLHVDRAGSLEPAVV